MMAIITPALTLYTHYDLFINDATHSTTRCALFPISRMAELGKNAFMYRPLSLVLYA